MYEQFFGLADAPFRLTPDPRYLYLSPKHAETLAHLRLGLTEPGGFVCITGDIGAGKTTVLRAFLADLAPEVATAYVFNPTLSSHELLRRIARDLGVPDGGDRDVDVMDALNRHLLAHRKDGRISVVVIDEAQAVSVDVLEHLRLLSNLETSTEKLLRLILVGQPQLASLLLDPALAQLNQRITLRWHLAPLTYAETVAYVRHRLAVAGGERAKRIFTGPALVLVHRLSKGVPRLVNMVAHRACLAAFVRRRRRVTARSVLRAYREIRAVPLHARSPLRRVGWLAAATATALGLAVATVGFPWRAEHREAPPQEVAPLDASAAPMPRTGIDVPSEDPVPRTVPAASVVEPPDESPTPTSRVADLQQRLAPLDPDRSARAAVDAILKAWDVSGLRSDEVSLPDRLEPVAWRRGLEELLLTGNLSMLRLLDLPGLLPLRLPGTPGVRFVALAGVDDQQVVLLIEGESVVVTPAVLDAVWLGEAHVLWRDFEGLGRTLGAEARGPQVARLQRLLMRAGAYDGTPTGVFDDATAAAVLTFQRSRLLVPDGRVGRLTRIVLYGAAGGHRRPSLTAGMAPPARAHTGSRGDVS